MQEALGTTTGDVSERAGLQPSPPGGELLSAREKRDLMLLRLIRRAGQPVGSGTVAAEMGALGVHVGEATIGRWLRDLEARGHVRAVGRQGRVLTPQGDAHLRWLEASQTQWEVATHLAWILLSLDERQLVDILYARRGLEGESAALAAQHATAAHLRRLEAIIRDGHDVNDIERHGQYDLDFHLTLADASGNKVVAAALRMIRSIEPRFPVFVHIRRSLGRRTLEEHEAIFQAVAERDPQKARQRMWEHIDHVIADVRRCWRTYGEPSGPTAAGEGAECA